MISAGAFERGAAMMDVVLGGAAGLLLAVLLTGPSRPKRGAIRATVVDDSPPTKSAPTSGKK